MDKKILNKSADNIRILSASMVEKSKSGHPGGAMGGADFINVLYSHFLNYDPNNFGWKNRDRFFLDPGHMSPMLYSQLALVGVYSMDDLKNFRQWESCTPGHPEVNLERGIENTSGPLGQGHTMAVGAAIAEKFLRNKFGDWMSHKIYTFISDGGVQEEISLGAARIAGVLGLNNLIMYYDSNNVQLSTTVDAVTVENVTKRYEAMGWRVISVDGSECEEIYNALTDANNEKEKPVLIIGKTVMGKGCVDGNGDSFEHMVSTHGQPISNAGADFVKTIENLGGNVEDPISLFDDVKEFYSKVNLEKIKYASQKQKEQEVWESKNPELAKKLKGFYSGETIKNVDFSKISQKADSPTRGASAAVLGEFATSIENMIVMSADLSNSDKTDGFLKKTTPILKNDFSGQFINIGVSELTMAAIANGLCLHGGIIPVCGTFFVFSDYMKPAIRMSALMELPVKYLWTHDSFRVGEDGPTHQPIEQEAQIRLMEKLKNHSGDNSMLVLRPADVHETTTAWELALKNTKTPTGLIFSRQNIKNIPNNSYEKSLQISKGAYELELSEKNPDLILFGNGSEVATLCEATEMLRKETDLKIRVVSVISEGLFRNQSAEYQKALFPIGIKRFGLTAGLSSTLESFNNEISMVYGQNVFGASAPFNVLDQKFGFNGENIKAKILEFIKK